MSVLDGYLVASDVSLLDKVKIQAQVLVPLLRALRAEVGADKADALARDALRQWSRELFAAIGAGIEGSPWRKFATMNKALGEISLPDVSVEIHRQDKEALEFDVTASRFAAFFRALGEPELGALLVCETDAAIAAVGGESVHFERTETLMRGHARCSFRYRFAREAPGGG